MFSCRECPAWRRGRTETEVGEKPGEVRTVRVETITTFFHGGQRLSEPVARRLTYGDCCLRPPTVLVCGDNISASFPTTDQDEWCTEGAHRFSHYAEDRELLRSPGSAASKKTS
jgi:hypothetical protein